MLRAFAAFREGNWDHAGHLCRAVLAAGADQFDALHLLGVIAAQSGRTAEASELLAKAVSVNPCNAQAHNNRGNALRDLGRIAEALQCYERALALDPRFAAAHYNRGNALHDQRRDAEAVTSFERAIALDPTYGDAHNNRGNALRRLGRTAEALASYEHALAIEPHSADIRYNRSNALLDLKRHPEALESYQQALTADPDHAYLFGDWLRMKMKICDWSGVAQHYDRLIEKIDRGEKASAPFFVLATPASLATQRRAAETWVRDRYPASHALPAILPRSAHDRIRLGYFSADFYDHAISHLVAELFERHDKSRFQLTGFSFGPDTGDEMRTRVSTAFDRFIDVRHMPDHEVAMLARSLEIDVAVDLNGFTQDSRTGIFAQRAAPVQVNYLGYPGTMGAGYIDYLIADRTVVSEIDRQHYCEKIACLPNSFQVNDTRRPISDRKFSREELGLPPSGFVFCSFNNNYKLTPGVFDRWMRLLDRVDHSVLWLLEDNAWAANNLRREAAQRGIDAKRLIFAPRMPLPEHLARHRLADLFLDTLPYNAHTTASDALWAGLPVLTCRGETFAGRVASSLLTAMELPQLVTATPDEYERLAIALATNPDMLRETAQELAARRLTAPLFDIRLFVRHIEAAYSVMHERALANLGPDHIDVPS